MKHHDSSFDLSSIVAGKSTHSLYDALEERPEKVLGQLGSFRQYLINVVDDYRGASDNQGKDPALITAQILDYYGQKLDDEGRNLLFKTYDYDPDNIVAFQQRYHTEDTNIAGVTSQLEPQEVTLEGYLARHSSVINVDELAALIIKESARKSEGQTAHHDIVSAQIVLIEESASHLNDGKRDALFAALNYNPMDVDGYRKRYWASIASESNGFKDGVQDSPAIENGFVAVDIPNATPDPREVEHALFARIQHQDKKDYYLYTLDDQQVFKDHGASIIMTPRASQSDEAILAAALLAQKKYGNSFELTGSSEFVSRAMGIMAAHGMEVMFKNPAQFAMYQAEMERQSAARPDVEAQLDVTVGGKTIGEEVEQLPNPVTPVDPTEFTNSPESASSVTNNDVANSDVDDLLSTIEPVTHDNNTGVLLAHGKAPYEFDNKKTNSYYVTIRNADKKETTFWGVDFPRALEESKVRIGEVVSLQHMGKRPVVVKSPVHDEKGKIVSYDEITVERNSWDVSYRSDVPVHMVDMKAWGEQQRSLYESMSLPMDDTHALKQSLHSLGVDEKRPLFLNQAGEAVHSDYASFMQQGAASKNASQASGQILVNQPGSIVLAKGAGSYLQGIALVSGKPHHVVAPLPSQQQPDVRLYALSGASGEEALKPIGSLGDMTRDKKRYDVKINLNGNSHSFAMQGGAEKALRPFLQVKSASDDMSKVNTAMPQQDQAVDVQGEHVSQNKVQEKGAPVPFHMADDSIALAEAQTIVIAQSHDSAHAIHRHTGLATVAALQPENIEPLTQHIHKTYPKAAIVIAGDNNEVRPDRDTPSDKSFALRAARHTGAAIVFPPQHVMNDTNEKVAINSFAQADTAMRDAQAEFGRLFEKVAERYQRNVEEPQHKDQRVSRPAMA